MADFDMNFETDNTFDMAFESDGDFNAGLDNVEIIQVGRYAPLPDKPSINGETLIDNKTSEELHLQHKMNRITEQMIDELLFGRN